MATSMLLRAQLRATATSASRLAARRSYATAASGELLSDQKAAENDNRWKGTSTNGSGTKLYIDGEWVSSTTRSWIDLHDPVSRDLPCSCASWVDVLT